MAIFYNPSLHQESRDAAAKIPPQVERETLLKWLERTGRLKSDQVDGAHHPKDSDELDAILDAELYPVDAEDE
ncbi:DUF3134 family protein [Nodosilinea sp. LEGE 07088]|uniref:DUF3134 family protein n=1 Tax=Nodosilinea sp. LEGE 07088 TaxID=2777968 RepID=UPI00188145B6|nr:DUF3134 family protein [Nodosilinea sp. LEGE 07088]